MKIKKFTKWNAGGQTTVISITHSWLNIILIKYYFQLTDMQISLLTLQSFVFNMFILLLTIQDILLWMEGIGGKLIK